MLIFITLRPLTRLLDFFFLFRQQLYTILFTSFISRDIFFFRLHVLWWFWSQYTEWKVVHCFSKKKKNLKSQNQRKISQNILNARHFDRNSINPTAWRHWVKFDATYVVALCMCTVSVEVNRDARDYVTISQFKLINSLLFTSFFITCLFYLSMMLVYTFLSSFVALVDSIYGRIKLPMNREVVVWWERLVCMRQTVALPRAEGSNNEKIV